ncbi:MAG: phage shock protein [Sphingomonadales bacterium]|jgi:rhodanese-related sulfurtransferase|nr:phage shock protein [Sphingomonadales bacterium]
MLHFALAALLAAAAPANPQIDYPGFRDLTVSVEAYRRQRLVAWDAFAAAAAEPGTLILDARSSTAFAKGHIKGAVNLPFTDFTAESLAAVIGDSRRPILIYCNNNFSNNEAPVQLKSVRLALNIQTFVNLVGYGYGNVRELNEVIDFNDPKVRWVKGS